MSRPLANKLFARLLSEVGKAEGNDICVEELVCSTHYSRQKIHAYTTNRRHFPKLEAALAADLHLSVPELRKRIGLPKEPQTTRRKISDPKGHSRAR